MRSPAPRMRSGPGVPGWLSRAIETGVHPWGQVMAPERLADGGGAVGDGDFEDLVAGQRGGRLAEGRLRVAECPFGGELGFGCLLPGCVDLLGDGAQHAGVGDPALDLLAVGGQHGQAVVAVDLKLAQGLSHRLVREKNLRVVFAGDRPGKRGGPGLLPLALARRARPAR